MRCLQHVLWRGAMALGLLVSAGAGALVLPQAVAPACLAGAGLAATTQPAVTTIVDLKVMRRS